jgi:tetrahydromethanopterin S-methyltransferase subunit G
MPDETPPMPSDNEIKARFDRIKENLDPGEFIDVDSKLEEILSRDEKVTLPQSEMDEYERKLSELEEKVKQAQAAKAKATGKAEDGSMSGSLDRGTAVGMGFGLTLAYTIVGTPIAGYFLGKLINSLTGRNGFEIWLTIIGGIIGVAWVSMVATRNANRF